MNKQRRFVVNQFHVKLIAIMAMVINHIGLIFLAKESLVRTACIDVGYCTAIIMCYFLVEGAKYTSSVKRYALRLVIFALISEIPYQLAFTESGIISFNGLNIGFTLFICLGIIMLWKSKINWLVKGILIGALTFVTLFFDWGLLASVFVILFLWSEDNREKQIIAFVLSAILFGVMEFMSNKELFLVEQNIWHSVGSASGIVLGALLILCCYSGKIKKATSFINIGSYSYYVSNFRKSDKSRFCFNGMCKL